MVDLLIQHKNPSTGLYDKKSPDDVKEISEDSNIENVLNSLQEEAQAEKRKNKFSAFSKETNLSKRIENVRKELYKMIDYFDGRTGGCEVIEMSQYLDELLSEHRKNGEDKCEGK